MSKLFLFAHQDDEFGVFHEIERLTANRETVLIVYLTDGSGRRDGESLAVLKKLGIPKEHVFFLGGAHSIADQSLYLRLDDVYNALLSYVATQSIDIIYTLAWEGGHPDHDAAFLLALALSGHLGVQLYQFPLYNAYRASLWPFRVMVPVVENGDIRREPIPPRAWLRHFGYFCSYPSQWKTWIILLPFFIAHYIFGGGQVLQKTYPALASKRPHAGRLLYERRHWLTYAQFDSAAREFKRRVIDNTPPVAKTLP